MIELFALALAPAVPDFELARQASAWRYVVPPASEQGAHAAPAALGLGPQPPEDVELADELVSGELGPETRYAQLRYGAPGSVRVALALQPLEGGGAHLYLDANRDRVLDPGDRLEGTGPRWVASLAVASERDGRPELVPRRVRFELGGTGLILSFATLGYLEGEVRLGERAVAARRLDGDGNGFFTDPQDRLWLDLDGDGAFAPFGERLLYAPVLQVAGGRWRASSDRLGSALALERLEGEGDVRLRLAERRGRTRAARAFHVLLVGRDGSAFGLTGVDRPARVPAGEYRLGMVTVRLDDPGGGQPWSFIFSESGERGSESGERDECVWYEVPRDGELVVDPVGELDFTALVTGGETAVAAGGELSVRPRLFTGDGLLVNVGYRGAESGWAAHGPRARIELRDEGGEVLARASSGFA